MWRVFSIISGITMLLFLVVLILGIIFKESYMFWIGLLVFHGTMKFFKYSARKQGKRIY